MRYTGLFLLALSGVTVTQHDHIAIMPSHVVREHSVVKLKDHAIIIKAMSRTQDVTSSLKFFFTTNGIPRLRLSAFRKDGETESAFTARSGLFAVVEKSDDSALTLEDINNGFKLFGATSSRWTNMSLNNVTAQVDSSDVTLRTVSTSVNGTAPYENTRLSLNVLLTTAAVNSNVFQMGTHNVYLNPDAMKYDVIIENWPFRSENATLYIIQGIWTKTLADDTVNNDYLNINAGQGAFGWAPWILCDSSNNTITTTQLNLNITGSDNQEEDSEASSDEQLRLFAHKFSASRNTARIYWDPVIALTADVSRDNSATSSKTSLWLSFAAIAMTVIALL